MTKSDGKKGRDMYKRAGLSFTQEAIVKLKIKNGQDCLAEYLNRVDVLLRTNDYSMRKMGK